MQEKIYNVFLHFDAKALCSKVSFRAYVDEGDDATSYAFLRERVDADFAESTALVLDKPFTVAEYNAHTRLGRAHHLIEQLFRAVGASSSPLFALTPVVNGVPHFNYSSGASGLDINEVAATFGARGKMDDWLVKYTKGDSIDLPSLINDDYFLAIKLTFNAKLYVSAMKLLVCCIDSVAYIEFGDEPSVFTKWLTTYADLDPLGITAAELWELRNGLLHMSNLNSKKVLSNKERRISFRVGGDAAFASGEVGVYYFDFSQLINAFSKALGLWIATYNVERDKFPKFVERYDQTISDSRLAISPMGSAYKSSE